MLQGIVGLGHCILIDRLWYFGCYHKDLETDRADDIVVNVIYSGPEGDFVISKGSNLSG
ncbi:MAG: hypothetical protein IPN95_16255 [Bacteroidetes bacterium]|nr:hypothetical protein [Bacteroidota bacterium]